MDKVLKELVRISKIVGEDSSYIQGGGGNTSAKTDDGKNMYIKASGTALKDMSSKKGWRRVNIESVVSIIQDESISRLETYARETEVVNRLLFACDDDVADGSRPSIEAHLHSYLDTYVIHLHPSSVGAYVNAKNGKAKLEKLFSDLELPFIWVRYADPGFLLAKRIARLIKGYKKEHGRKARILFLEKHGLLITANSASSCLKLTQKVIARCNKGLVKPKSGCVGSVSKGLIKEASVCIGKACFDVCGEYGVVAYYNSDIISWFMKNKSAAKMLKGTLTPDELLYSNGPAVWVGQLDWRKLSVSIRAILDKGEKMPVSFLVKDVGLFVTGEKKIVKTIRDVVTSILFIRVNAIKFGGLAFLNKRQKDFINKWESEAFRKSMAAGANKKCD